MHEDPVLSWRLTDPARIRIRRFGDEALIFNPLSWETHLLGLPAMSLIEALARGPMREVDLARTLVDDDEEAAEAEALMNRVRALLDELWGLGIVSASREAP